MANWKNSYRETRKLAGGRLAKINVEEANAWHEFLGARPEWLEVKEVEAKLDATGLLLQGGVESARAEFESLSAKHHELTEQIYAISKEWDEARIAALDEESKQEAADAL